jgi:hypothetical protein
MRTRTIAGAVLLVVTLPVWAMVSLAGGVAGVLGEVGSEPNADDRPEAPAIGLPTDVTATAAAAPKRDLRVELQARIDALRLQIEAMRKLRPETIQPVDGQAEADREITRLETALAKAKGDLATVDQDETARLAKRTSDFDAKYGPLAEAIESGQKPEDVSALDWAHRCDEYFHAKADYEADLAETQGHLQRQMDRKLAGLTRAVQDARGLAERVRGLRDLMTPGERQFMDRMITWKAHQAKLMVAQETLQELGKLQADLEGATELRGDAIEAEAVEQTGFLLADALRKLVLRELSLAEATPLPSPQDLEKGLPLPEWMTVMDPRARAQGRHAHALEQLRLATKALVDLEQDVQDQDAQELRYLREIGFGEADLRDQAQALAKTRQTRMLAREDELLRSRDNWRNEVAEDTAALEQLTPPPASQPAETP